MEDIIKANEPQIQNRKCLEISSVEEDLEQYKTGAKHKAISNYNRFLYDGFCTH